MAEQWFFSLGGERVLVGISDAQSTVFEGCSFKHAILTYTARSIDGKELRSLSNRITGVLKRTDKSWKILHEHTSSPVDHGSLKAMLQFLGRS